MKATLEHRFIAFARNLTAAEYIDDLNLTHDQKAAQKADFFFNNRGIICELKSLKTNTEDKIEKILESYRDTPEWPDYYDEQELTKVLERFPDKEKLNTKIFSAVTDSIEGLIEKANRQIRTTKQTFNLLSAGGLLIILNDLVDVLTPNVLAHRVRKTLAKRTADGDVRFPHITLVWAINAAHYTQLTPHLKAMPILIIPSGLADPNDIEGFVQMLGKKWAAHDGKPYLKGDARAFKKFEYRKFSADETERKQITRTESWRRDYRKNPYLQSLSKEELIEYGARMTAKMGRMFMKGAKRKPSKKDMMK